MRTTMLLILLLTGHAAAAGDVRFRDATTGTASRDSAGTVEFRDAPGRSTGTASRDSGGTIHFRDAADRSVGTATGRAR
jgi:hypothetical protein